MHAMARVTVAAVAGVVLALIPPMAAVGQGRQSATSRSTSDTLDVIARIRREAYEHSRVMALASYLTDVVGPRLTNSPNIRRAQAYARDQLRSWGIRDARLERWGPFGRGWALEAIDVSLTSPDVAPLIAYPKAWSASTEGPVTGQPVILDVKSAADLERYRGQLMNRIVLLSPAGPIAPPAVAERLTDAFLLNLANAGPPLAGGSEFHPTAEQRAAAEIEMAKWRLVYSELPAVVIEDSPGPSGSVYVTAATVPPDAATGSERHPWDANKPPVVPQIVMAAEHYNRLIRLAALSVPFTLRVNLATRYLDDDVMSDNVIGEIPGSDLSHEVVMFGGCLDSWHTGTGATDNASGAAVALEAMRILQTLDLHPRRSIRVGLWSAEEQGTLGSRAYVAAHFGRRVVGSNGQVRIERGPEYEALAGYFNLDWGAGRIRGVYLQGNEAVRPIFRAWLAPFQDLGASTLTARGIGASDHMSFDDIGLPGFQFIRDFWEGRPTSAHTNMDVYDRLSAEDLEQSASVVAAFAYQLAMRDEKLPRK
jgi:carboxypeptidase Q